MSDVTKIKVDGELENTYKLFSKNREFEKRAGGNGSSQSGVQPDWNQNDSTAADYVKNRPFYTGDSVETVLVEESTVSFVDMGKGLYTAEFPSTFSATVGETYKVSWDGTVYECTCVDLSGDTIIGNISIMGAGSDTGEPFLFSVVNGRGIMIGTTDTSASHTFSISGLSVEVVKIDEKYLPDNLAIKSDVEVAQTTAENAQTTAENAKTAAETALPLAGGRMAGNIVTEEGVGIQADTVVTHRIILSGKVSKPDVAFEKYASNKDSEISLYAGFTNMGNYNSYVKFLFSKGENTANLVLPSPSNESTLPSVLVLEGANNEHTSVVVDNVNTIVFRKGSLSNDYYHLKADDNGSLVAENFKGIIINSSTAGSTKKFKITVDDSGALTATEITQ